MIAVKASDIDADRATVEFFERRERHLKIRAYQVHELGLPVQDRPRTPEERNKAMREFMAALDAELTTCSTCCKVAEAEG